jgi:hypothetical protein
VAFLFVIASSLQHGFFATSLTSIFQAGRRKEQGGSGSARIWKAMIFQKSPEDFHCLTNHVATMSTDIGESEAITQESLHFDLNDSLRTEERTHTCQAGVSSICLILHQ